MNFYLYIINLIFILLIVKKSVKSAFHKVKTKAIIKKNNISDIMEKYKNNTYILYTISIVSSIISVLSDTTILISTIINVVLLGVILFMQINYAKKLLIKEAEQ